MTWKKKKKKKTESLDDVQNNSMTQQNNSMTQQNNDDATERIDDVIRLSNKRKTPQLPVNS